MTERCSICGKENDDKLTIVVSLLHRMDVCAECCSDYSEQKYDKLIAKLKNSGGKT